MAFCKNCGNQLADGTAFCTKCGTSVQAVQPQQPQQPVQQPIQQPAGQQVQQPIQPQQPFFNQTPFNGGGSKDLIGVILGIVSVVLGFVGSILYGVFLGIPGIIAGVVGLVFAVDAKKKTNNQKGTAALVICIIGICLSLVFTIGCALYGAGTLGYGCYGLAGASCKASKDIYSIFK